jgi:hypothetical protein
MDEFFSPFQFRQLIMIFASGEAQMCLWQDVVTYFLIYGLGSNKIHYSEPFSLRVSCNFLFPMIELKMFFLRILQLKFPNRMLMCTWGNDQRCIRFFIQLFFRFHIYPQLGFTYSESQLHTVILIVLCRSTTICHCSSHHHIECFKDTGKSYEVATRKAETKRVKTAPNSQRSKASNAVIVTYNRAVRGQGWSASVVMKHANNLHSLAYKGAYPSRWLEFPFP